MLPKRPVSCLAVGLLPVGLLLLLVVFAGFGLKVYLGMKTPTTASIVQTEQPVIPPTPAPVSRLPASIPTTTQVLVAIASANVAKEEILLIDRTGTPMKQNTPEGFRPEQWKTQGIILIPPNDSVTSSPWKVTGNGWNVPLRTRSGAKWQDPVIVGRFASGRLAIVAYRTQRALLSVDRSGDIQVIDVLDDELAPLTVQGKNVWFVRSQQSELLDEQFQGPSYLVRLSEQGTSSTVAQDPGMILSLVPSPNPSTLAYLSSDGSLVILSGEQLRSEIKGWRPQVWLDERYLLVSRAKELAWVDKTNPTKVIHYADLENTVRGVTISTTGSKDVVN